MSTSFTLDDLVRIMRACAGEHEAVDLSGDVGDIGFDELGYDSLALMETASRIQRETGIVIADEDLADLSTPGQFVAHVHEQLLSSTGQPAGTSG